MSKRIIAIVMSMILCVSASSCSGSRNADGDGIYASNLFCNNVVYYMLGSRVMYSLADETDRTYPACVDPLCTHSYEECPAYASVLQNILVIPQKDSVMPLIYMFGRRPPVEYIDGKMVVRTDEEINLGRIKVYDAEAGVGYTLAETDFSRVHDAVYFDGKIYMTVEYLDGRRRVGMIDTDTGEYVEIKNDTPSRVAGISDGRLYYITNRGIVYSCDLALSDETEVYDCGTGPFRRGAQTFTPYVDGGILYFERNCRIADGMTEHEMGPFLMVSDVYAVDLDDKDAGGTLVAEHVLQFKPHGGDLYYNVWQYENGGSSVFADGNEREVMCVDGGTLYRYDHKSGTSEICFSDIGTSFYEIYEVTDDYIIFEGMQYDMLDSYNTENAQNTRYFLNYVCICDIKTGKWHVLQHTNSDA